jgi:hypothetical protein
MEELFKDKLKRSYKQLKDDRAEAVVEELETAWKRKVEDLCHDIKKIDRDRNNLIDDLSPDVTFKTNVVPSDFDGLQFMNKDIELGMKRRNALIVLRVTLSRYEDMFGEYPDKATIEKILPNYYTNNKEEEED